MIRYDSSALLRDHRGRPVIDGKTYTRVSTFAKALNDQSGLIKWASRMAVLGISSSPDLIAEASVADPKDSKALNQIAERAQDRVKARAGASVGTATHTAADMIDSGESIAMLPQTIQDDVLAYRRWLIARDLVPLASEMFVVNQELGVAGTFDRLLRGPNRAIVSDMKTSANPDIARYSALSWAIQVACYAYSLPWISEVGIVSWESIGLPAPDREKGLIIHLAQGEAEVVGYSVDLVKGMAAARLASSVRRARTSRDVITRI